MSRVLSNKFIVPGALVSLAMPLFCFAMGSAPDPETVSIETGSASAGSAIGTSSTENSTPDFYAPAPAVELFKLSRATEWTELQNKPVSLSRFAIGRAGTNDLFIAADDGRNVNESLSIVAGATAEETSSYDLLLRSMFKFIELDDGTFRIVSSKHPNYALDVDETNALILRDFRSVYRDHDQTGYLGFNVTSTSPLVLTATSRWVFEGNPRRNEASQNFVTDKTWERKNVVLTESGLALTTGEGSLMQLYSPPINFDIPFEFNPKEKTRARNVEVTPFSRGGDRHAELSEQVLPAYEPQVAAPGLNAATSAAAQAKLLEIERALASQDSQLRYPKEFYMTFREGMLERIYLSSEATDAQLGQYTVPYVYFTNATDEEGIYHPFMVIATYGLPDTQALLWDVVQPPGDGITGGFNDQSVTRSYHKEGFVMKVPMKDYGEVSELGENIMVNDLAADENVTELDHHNYASVSGLGIAIDGVVVYPTYNNALHISAAEGELSAHGQHSGRGLGTHYHADAYSATNEILNLYNTTDYLGRSHPPMVTLGFDGVAGYGIYRSADSDGAAMPLDDFGGHEHGDYGYHYHSFSAEEITYDRLDRDRRGKGVTYISHKLPPLGAWAGYINDIPDFWDGTSPNYGGRGETRWLGNGTDIATEARRARPAPE